MKLQSFENGKPVIAVDFDGTLCENRWPEIGAPIAAVVDYVKRRQADGARLILWTNRSGERLDEAVHWCGKQGIVLNAVNENLPDVIERFGGDTRKVFADEYLDDKATQLEDIEKEYKEAQKMQEIKEITKEELRKMSDHEGIVFEGCSEFQDWINGITDDLTRNGILLNGSRFQEIYSFQKDGLTCLLFDFKGAKLDVGKLAMWRLRTYDGLGGTWLSDYVPNRLGGFIRDRENKPDCKLIGEDGNIFNLMGIASRTLKECGMKNEAREMTERIMGSCSGYTEALGIIADYVNIVGANEEEDCSYEMEEMNL